jgi:hypothetical protein
MTGASVSAPIGAPPSWRSTAGYFNTPESSANKPSQKPKRCPLDYISMRSATARPTQGIGPFERVGYPRRNAPHLWTASRLASRMRTQRPSFSLRRIDRVWPERLSIASPPFGVMVIVSLLRI